METKIDETVATEISMRPLALVTLLSIATLTGCGGTASTDTPAVDATDSVTATDTASDAPVTCGSSCAADPSVCQAQIGGRAYCDPMNQTCACPP